MKTDKQLFEIFHAAPRMMAELLQLEFGKVCRYESVTVKAIEKQADGVLILEDRRHVEFVEWQFYSDPEIYNRLVMTKKKRFRRWY